MLEDLATVCSTEDVRKQLEESLIKEDEKNAYIKGSDPSVNDFVSWEELRLMGDTDDEFRTKPNATDGWNKATSPYKIHMVPEAKRAGRWKDNKLSLSWLKSTKWEKGNNPESKTKPILILL